MIKNNRNGGAELDKEPLWTSPFVIMTVCYFLLFLCLQMLLSPFPSYMKERFNPGDVTVSLSTSLFAFTAIVTRFITAALMKRISRTTLLYTGLAIAAGATAAYSYADTVTGVLLLRVCFGIGFGMGSTIMPTLVTEIIPRTRLGEGIGYFGLSTSMAMSVGPVIGLSILGNYGFPMLTVLGAVVAGAAIPLSALVQSRGGQSTATKETAGSADAGAPADQKSKKSAASGFKLFHPALLNTLLSVSYGGLLSFLALFGKEAHIDNIGVFFLFNAITVLAVRPISGRLFDTRGYGVILAPAALSIVTSLFLLASAEGLPLLIASALLYGLGYGAIQPTIQAWMLQVSEPSKRGMVNSLFYNTIDFGVAIGSILLGMVASATSYSVMYRFSAGVMVLFLVIFGCVQVSRSAAARKAKSAASAIEKGQPELSV